MKIYWSWNITNYILTEDIKTLIDIRKIQFIIKHYNAKF